MFARILWTTAWVVVIALMVLQGHQSRKFEEFPAVEYRSNYDGDTVRFDIPIYPSIVGENMPVRIAGIDAPEMKGDSECERTLALKAKRFVGKTLRSASLVRLRNLKRGKYFRLVSDLLVDGVDLGQEILRLGLAVPYSGGRKARIDWCIPLRNVKNTRVIQ